MSGSTVLIIAAMYFSAVGLFGLVTQMRVLNWPMTTGRLSKRTLASMGPRMLAEDEQFEADVEYSYQVSGTSYDGDRLSPWQLLASFNLKSLVKWQMKGITEVSDGEVEVYYDPAAPEKSFLIKPGMLGLAFTAAVAALPLIFLAFNL